MGYALPAQESGGYPTGYITQANKIGLTRSMEIHNTEPLNWSAFVRLLYQSLFIDIMQPISYGTGAEYGVIPGDTLLTNVMQIEMLTNVLVTANTITGLNGSQGVRQGYVEIDGQLFQDTNGAAGGYIGRMVNVYYREDSDSNRVILYAEPAGSNTEPLVIRLADVDLIDGYTIYYYSEDGGSRRQVTIAEDANMLFNSQAVAYNPTLINKEARGRLVLYRSAAVSGGYDLAVVTQYTAMLVDSIDYERQIIYDRLEAGRTLELEKYFSENRCDIRRNGAEISLMDIAADTVLAVYNTPDDSYISIAVVDETVSGVIQSVDNEMVVINEESYRYDEALREQLQSRLGDSCTAYMDVDETIIWLSGVQTTDMQYGYLIQGVSQKSGIENVVQLRLLTENNSIEIFDLDSKVQINGERYTSVAAISTAVGLLAPVGTWEQQLIQYKTNTEGKITALNTATVNPDPVPQRDKGNVFYCSREKTDNQQYKSGGSFSMQFSVNSNTKIFVVSPTNETEDEAFRAESTSYFVNDSRYTVAAYNIDEGGTAEAVVCWKELVGGEMTSESPMVMVDYIASGLNSEGETVQILYDFMNGQYIGYPTNGELMLEAGTGEERRSLKRGDVVRVALNASNEIVGLSVDVNIDTQRTVSSSFGTVYSRNWAISGVVYSLENNFAIVSNVIQEPLSSIDFTDVSNVYSTRLATNIMIYDEELDEVYAGTSQDILPYKTVGERATRFFARFRYESMQTMFIFKYKD